MELRCPYRPAKWPEELALRRSDPPAERTARGDLRIDDRDQLEIGVAQGHDAIGGPPRWMPTTLRRRQPILVLDPARRFPEIGHGNKDVVKLGGVPFRDHGR